MTGLALRPDSAPPTATALPAAAPSNDVLTADGVNCVKAGETLRDVALAITGPGGAANAVPAIEHAETRMTRRLGTPDTTLAALFRQIHDTLDRLRVAAAAGAPTEEISADLTTLIDPLATRCSAVLLAADAVHLASATPSTAEDGSRPASGKYIARPGGRS